MSGPYDDIAERLERIEEDLSDLGFDRLRALARDPDSDDASTIKAEERALTSARRAIAKARQTLLNVAERSD